MPTESPYRNEAVGLSNRGDSERKPSQPGGSAALAVAAGIFVSRIIGFVRDRIFAHYLGNGAAAGAFRAAARIPNILQNLLGEGALSASFIPVYAKLLAEGKQAEAKQVASAVFSALVLVLTIFTALGMTFSEELTDLLAGGFEPEVRSLTVTLVRIMFPGVALLALAAWCLGVLNSHRRFFLSYVSPIAWSLTIIIALIAYGDLAGDTQGAEQLVTVAAWATVLGAGLQFCVQLPSALRLSGGIRPAFGLASGHVQRVARNFVPAVLSRGVVQISAYIDQRLASELGNAVISGGSVVAAMYNASAIYTLPVSLFGMSVSAAELPAMVGIQGEEQAVQSALRQRQSAGHRRIAFFVVPSFVAFVVLGDLIVGTLFQTGRFGLQEVDDVWGILAAASLGLLASTQGRLCASGLWALGDTRTPFRFATLRVALAAGLGILWALWAVPTFGVAPMQAAAGLAAASGSAAWIECLLVRRALRQRIGAFSAESQTTMKLTGVALLAAGVAFALKFSSPTEVPWLRGPVLLATYGGIYWVLALWLRNPEAAAILAKVRGRIPQRWRR